MGRFEWEDFYVKSTGILLCWVSQTSGNDPDPIFSVIELVQHSPPALLTFCDFG